MCPAWPGMLKTSAARGLISGRAAPFLVSGLRVYIFATKPHPCGFQVATGLCALSALLHVKTGTLNGLLIKRGNLSRRRYAAVYVGLPDALGHYSFPRSSRFLSAWAGKWPALRPIKYSTFLHHPDLRGLGSMVGIYMALVDVLARDEFDYLLCFEDDALPFNFTSWPRLGRVNHLDAHIGELERLNGSALILGGHDFVGYDPTAARNKALMLYGGIVPVRAGLGSYAYLLRRDAARVYMKTLHEWIAKKDCQANSSHLAADNCLYNALLHTGVYVSVPLLVDHAPGQSATWGVERHGGWQGRPDFWNLHT